LAEACANSHGRWQSDGIDEDGSDQDASPNTKHPGSNANGTPKRENDYGIDNGQRRRLVKIDTAKSTNGTDNAPQRAGSSTVIAIVVTDVRIHETISELPSTAMFGWLIHVLRVHSFIYIPLHTHCYETLPSAGNIRLLDYAITANIDRLVNITKETWISPTVIQTEPLLVTSRRITARNLTHWSTFDDYQVVMCRSAIAPLDVW
jgi:hypothetical protein